MYTDGSGAYSVLFFWEQDFDKDTLEKTGNGIYTPMDPKLIPSLHLIYAKNPSDSGKARDFTQQSSVFKCGNHMLTGHLEFQVHSTVRKRWLDGDEKVRSCMKEVADLAVKGREALLQRDFHTIAKLMDRNFDLRKWVLPW